MIDWIRQTVNTAGRPCPLRLAERCPGERSGCAFWVTQTLESGAQRELVEGCMFTFQFVQLNALTLESVRTQAGIDKAAETMRKAGAGLLAAVTERRLAIEGDR